ncbi:ATP-binding protein [Microvirga pudoricolor]|uniref:ATP-binding protein n=1 Tax=Microvirga pudoricolor TaxID=2778729 RepID=UPI0019527335|nr:ATP-binding protein [Microvirga pudoricolor]MBM6594235.1 MASE4 domain-containing protein [Microvirga pudoricolor]
MTDATGRHPFLLTTAAPNRRQRRLAWGILAALACALLVAAPFARLILPGTEIVIPAYAAAAFLVEILTSALLFALFSVDRSRSVLLLATGYLLSGLLVLPWALTFPGVFTPLGLDPDIQVTPLIAAVRRLGFAGIILAYALAKKGRPGDRIRGPVGRVIAGRVALVLAGAAGIVLLAVLGAGRLPAFMQDARNVTPLWSVVPAASVALYSAGLAALWTRSRSTLDLWLMVVLGTLLIEILLISYLGGATRLSVGWWAGRFFGLASASVVLLVLLSETTTLLARLARSVRSERLARESRLTAMEALSASIAHEINQPLASMVTSASAGLRWLDKDVPRVGEARSALERVVRDGHRARDTVDGIRNLFRTDTRERVPVDLNRLIEGIVRRSEEETRLGQVSIETRLQQSPLPVTANPLQMEQVVSNLVANAVDALSTVTDRPRIVRVTTRSQGGSALVTVEDTGPGIAADIRDRIFDPFFSTKPEGMGMGLMFSRSIVEDHGGRLWASDNRPSGAVFHFTLPSGPASGAEAGR